MSKYAEDKKEKWMMYFLERYSSYRPNRMSKEKINNNLAKFWDNEIFWHHCADKFKLFNDDLKANRDDLHKAATNFWWMLDKGVPKNKDLPLAAETKSEAEIKEQKINSYVYGGGTTTITGTGNITIAGW